MQIIQKTEKGPFIFQKSVSMLFCGMMVFLWYDFFWYDTIT